MNPFQLRHGGLLAGRQRSRSDRICEKLGDQGQIPVPDGHRVEVFANQKKRQSDEPDFFLVVVVSDKEAGR